MASNLPPRGGTRHRFGPPAWRRRPPREAPATFGDVLRQARRARGLSLEEAAAETRIPFKYLAALEDQEYGALPTGVYARGVLRAYASFLELEPELLLAQFRPPRPRDDRGTIRPALPLAASGPPLSWSLLVGLLIALGAALLTVYLYGQYLALSDSLQAPELPAAGALDVPEPLIPPWTPEPRGTIPPLLVAAPPEPEAPPEAAEALEPAETPGPGAPTVLAQATVTPAPPSPTPAPPPSPTPSPLPQAAVVVEARVTERCYVQVWSDGQPVFADTVSPGTSRTFTANDRLQMRVSNAGGIQVLVNGEPQGRLGTPGQAIDVTWGRR
ncbi:MAG TPA: helix-turn-helix domain-containing protein [Chloroflexota bacterium]|jgi:cytoskeleton protein RodZ